MYNEAPPPLHFDPLDSNRITELLERNLDPIDSLSTGFPTWDKACIEFGGGKGLGPGYYVVLAGATGKLKSTTAINVIASALRQGMNTGLINFEMSQRQSASRLLTVMTGAHTREIQAGPQYDHDRAQMIAQKVDDLATDGARVWANREPVFTLADLEESADRLVSEKGVGLLVVDYLQLIEVSGVGGWEASKVVSDVVRSVIHRHEIRGLALAQLGTEAGRKGKSPNRYDLFGGGKWAHDANQIVLVDHTKWRERYDRKIETRIIIDKNRHGPEGFFDVLFDPKNMQIVEHDSRTESRVKVAADSEYEGEVPF